MTAQNPFRTDSDWLDAHWMPFTGNREFKKHPRFFVGAEARFRYAAGTYSYELASGPAHPFDRGGVDTWSASTVDLAVALGGRF